MAKQRSSAPTRRVINTSREPVDAGIATIVSCNAGAAAYVRMPGGATRHLHTSSDEFLDAMRVLAGTARAPRVRTEIDTLAARTDSAWPAVAARLEAAGVWASA